jgi:integrase
MTPSSKVWALCLNELKHARCRFRIRRIGASPFIRIREYQGNEIVRDFIAKPLRWDSDDDVREARNRCLEAHKTGVWFQHIPRVELECKDWQQVADITIADVRRRIPKIESRNHCERWAKVIARYRGPVTAQKLIDFVLEVDPIEHRAVFNQRIDFLSQINKANKDLDLSKALETVKAERPDGAAAKVARAAKEKVRIIPSDEEIRTWLHGLDAFNQWVFAMLCTYGLRPHELWHVVDMDDRGWITVPGGPQADLQGRALLTKTSTHHVPPVPSEWVQEFKLKERFDEYRMRLRDRWKIQWGAIRNEGEEDEIVVPINNGRLGQYLHKQFSLRGVQKLFCEKLDGSGTDWVRPYSMRHTYAIRCSVHPETFHVPMTQQAKWMGHGIKVHEDTYLKWINPARQRRGMQRWLPGQEEAARDDKAALQAEVAMSIPDGPPENVPEPTIDPAVLAELQAEIEKLRRVNSKQKKMIDALQEEDDG